MSLSKIIKDHLIKALFGKELVPSGLHEMDCYFRQHGPINFDLRQEDGVTVAVSKDFVFGSIVTSGATPEELDKNIKDAIMTSFEIPSSYAKEAGIKKFGTAANQYAPA